MARVIKYNNPSWVECLSARREHQVSYPSTRWHSTFLGRSQCTAQHNSISYETRKIMTPPSGGGKLFSTSSPRPWQYSIGTALRIAGPLLPKKKEQTRVGLNKETATYTLPLALRFCPLPNTVIPDLGKSKEAREQLAEMVSPIFPTEHQSTMRTKRDIT